MATRLEWRNRRLSQTWRELPRTEAVKMLRAEAFRWRAKGETPFYRQLMDQAARIEAGADE